MRTPGLVLYLSLVLDVAFVLAVRLNALSTQIGEDFSKWPSLSTVADVAECWVLLVLVIIFGAVLDSKQKARQQAKDDENETRVTVKTPPEAANRVFTKVVVSNHPGQPKEDSSEFELTLG